MSSVPKKADKLNISLSLVTTLAGELNTGENIGTKDNSIALLALHGRHNERNTISNYQPHDYLLNCLLRHR